MRAIYKEFRVTASYTGSKKAGWSGQQENWNHHRVTVYNTETKKRTYFDFWASIANPELQSEYDVLNAFYCFVLDAISGTKSFEFFCDEFGYDTDSRSAHKTWRACQKSYNQLNRLTSRDLYDLANELSENYS